MTYLLDTNVTLLALATPELLSSRARRAVLSGPNVLSSLVFWEVVLKSMKGSLAVGDPRLWWSDALDQLAATPLAFRPEHISEICTLPSIHKDPFDRGLIAQAIIEDLTLVTTDAQIPKYASARLRVIHERQQA
jgi:PIN domain nuclease of toxin-antitoxin system